VTTPNTHLETVLSSLPPEQWVTRQATVYDWYDGPREGVCALSRPEAEFYFELLDERYNPDGLDDRLFRLSELPPGSVDAILSALQNLGTPVNSVWIPVWKFPSEAAQQRAEQRLREIEAVKRPTPMVILTQDMEQFLGCWNVPPTSNQVADWFSVLRIPQEQTTGE
jgi:hypothetical protein